MNITIIDNVHLRIDNVHYMLYSTIVIFVLPGINLLIISSNINE